MLACDPSQGSFASTARALHAAIFALCCFAAYAAPNDAYAAAPRIVINEVHYHPADNAPSGEFIELLNHGSDSVEIGGWSLGGGVRMVFPGGTTIPAGGFLVVARDRDMLAKRHGLEPHEVIGNFSGSLSNGGERLGLITAAGYLVSFVDYRDTEPWPEAPDGLGPSLERRAPLLEDADPLAWASSLRIGGTPGAPNSVSAEPEDDSPAAARDLLINEVLTSSTPDIPGAGWIELFNPTTSTVDASGRRVAGFPSGSREYTIPPGTEVPAGGFLVITETELGFELDDVPVVTLTTPDERFVDGFNPRTTVDGLSSGRLPDGDGMRVVFREPSRAETNRAELDQRVVINEIQYHPGDAQPDTEYIELYNNSFDIVDFTGWAFTRGVSFEFLEGTTLLPGRFLVVARNPAAVVAAFGLAEESVTGPYRGSLRNDAETLLLRDAFGNPVDRCRYADEGSWPEEADGLGPSVELVHPALENRYGAAWAASVGSGTPGARNSRYESNPAPVAVGVSHHPTVPTSSDSVRVLVTVSDDAFVAAAGLHWQIDGAVDVETSETPLRDDGVSDDGVAGNNIYGADIPPAPDGTVIAFWIRARDSSGQSVIVPRDAPEQAHLYQVEGQDPSTPRPLYRLVLRQAVLEEFRTRGIGSNELLNTTFVAHGKAYYNRGIRLRGSSARLCDPPSYRIQFDHDVDLHGIKRLNLNGCRVHRQWIGYDFLMRAGLPSPLVWFRNIAFNGQSSEHLYLRVEAIDEQFLERTMPDDSSGNLYRGVSRAYLDYRGEDPDEYRDHYSKRSNEAEDDYSDVIALCFGLDDETTADEDFPAFVETNLDVEEWARFFAAFACLGSTEHSILLDSGDDYFLYRRPSDELWLALPWDLDSCFEDSEQELFRPTVDSVERFLEHPRYASSYWCQLRWMIDSFFDPDTISTRLDHLRSLLPSSRINVLQRFVNERHAFIADRLIRELRFDVVSGAERCEGDLEVRGDTLELAGVAPGCGTSEVLINATPARLDPLLSTWTAGIDVGEDASIEIVARDRFGNVTESKTVPLIDRSRLTSLPPTISGTRVLTRPESPYYLPNNVIVLADAQLVIEAGVELLFDSDATLRVQGRLLARGTSDSPIRFRGDECNATWEGIEFRPGSTGNLMEYVQIDDALAAESRAAAIFMSQAEVTLRQSIFVSSAAQAIRAENGAMLTAEDTTIVGAENALGISESDATIEDCRFVAIGDRAIWVRGRGDEPIRVLWSVIELSGLGIELTDGAEAVLSHLTLFGNQSGLVLRQDPGDTAPGRASADSIILWGSPLPVFETSAGLLDISFSNGSLPLPAGEGNLQVDPLFAAAAERDYRLLAKSPCRGRGKDGSDMGAFPFAGDASRNTFLLCDANADGDHDISDVVFTLLGLFSGGTSAPCQIAADCNSDRAVNVSDAVFDLAHIFGAGEPPRAPYPLCDEASRDICATDTCFR